MSISNNAAQELKLKVANHVEGLVGIHQKVYDSAASRNDSLQVSEQYSIICLLTNLRNDIYGLIDSEIEVPEVNTNIWGLQDSELDRKIYPTVTLGKGHVKVEEGCRYVLDGDSPEDITGEVVELTEQYIHLDIIRGEWGYVQDLETHAVYVDHDINEVINMSEDERKKAAESKDQISLRLLRCTFFSLRLSDYKERKSQNSGWTHDDT